MRSRFAARSRSIRRKVITNYYIDCSIIHSVKDWNKDTCCETNVAYRVMLYCQKTRVRIETYHELRQVEKQLHRRINNFSRSSGGNRTKCGSFTNKKVGWSLTDCNAHLSETKREIWFCDKMGILEWWGEYFDELEVPRTEGEGQMQPPLSI